MPRPSSNGSESVPSSSAADEQRADKAKAGDDQPSALITARTRFKTALHRKEYRRPAAGSTGGRGRCRLRATPQTPLRQDIAAACVNRSQPSWHRHTVVTCTATDDRLD